MQQALAGIQQYASVALIGWASGINLYLATALAGVCGRMGVLPLPGELDVLKNPLIIGLAVLLYAVEFVADKVPYVDSFWDSFHTVIRPGAAAVMGAMAGTDLGPIAQTVLSIGAGTAVRSAGSGPAVVFDATASAAAPIATRRSAPAAAMCPASPRCRCRCRTRHGGRFRVPSRSPEPRQSGRS